MKKLIYALILLMLLMLPARSAFAWEGGMLDGRVVIGQNFTLKSGDTLNGDLVVIGGEATIQSDAVVEGDVVVIGGSLNLNGKATGNAVVIGGVAALGEKASLAGDMVTLGGSLQRANGAEIGGNIVNSVAPPTVQFPNEPATVNPPVPPTPPVELNSNPFWKVASIFFQALGLAALAMLLTVFLHPQLDRVAQTVMDQPIIAGSIGLLTAIVAPLAIVVLAITLILTLILIPIAVVVAFLAAFLLVLAVLFGIVAVGMEIGDRFTRAIHQTWEPVVSAGAGTFLLAIAVGTVGLLPCIGLLAKVLIGLVGLGAVAMTLFGTRPAYQSAFATTSPTSGAESSGSIPPAS